MQIRRALGGEVRAAAAEDGQHTVTLQAIRPGVVDDYGSLWQPDAFDRSLAERLPTLCWSHDWSDPIGHGLDYQTTDQGPVVRFAFDDFDAVPRARQAFAQTQSGTIRDCSVGFSKVTRREPTEDELQQYPGVREVILSARMDELSLVLAGAVPGAKVVGVRMANQDAPVSRESVAKLLAQLATGEFTLTQALNELDELPVLGQTDDDDSDPAGDPAAGGEGSGDGTGAEAPAGSADGGEGSQGPGPDPELDAQVDELLAEVAETLAGLEA